MNRVRVGTWAMGVVAAAAMLVAHNDPWADGRVVAPLTSTRTGARRLLPALAEVDVALATIELRPASGPVVRLEARPQGGHALWEGEALLGPADPEAVEGLWSSLRMATTVRAVAEGTDTGLPGGGTITLSWPGQQRVLSLGQATADEAGVYGALADGALGTEGLWVVENELSILLSQAARAWLARRAVVAEASHIEAVTFAQREGRPATSVERGADGLWRSGGAMLESRSVTTRIERVLSARMDPLLPPVAADAAAPWLTLRDIAGSSFALALAGPCPGRPDRTVLVRGPGLAGCIDAELTGAWPLATLLQPRLLPHGYGAVLSIEQRAPEARTLARYGGGWRLEETLQGREIATEVDEPEVFRFYGALHDAEVERAAAVPPGPEAPEIEWSVRTETGVALELTCWAPGADGRRRCRRDQGPVLAVRNALGPLALVPELFSDRRLVTQLSIDDVRAVEILPGGGRPDDERGRRQSAHFDLGVWRLDAPTHPDGDDAMDSTRLEALLAAVAGLRAASWVEPPGGAPLRVVRVEQVARAGLPETVEVALHAGCIAVVSGRRPALLSESACRRLAADLLFDDPLSAWLSRAAAIEITPTGEDTVALQRVGEGWARADGAPMGTLGATLSDLSAWRAESVVGGQPAGTARLTLRVRPVSGAAFEVAVGSDWAKINGADWWYQGPVFP